MSGVINAVVFLIKTVIDCYIMLLFLRLMMGYFHANYYNPLSQLVVKLTGPVVKPFQRFVPSFKGVDLAIAAVIILLEMIKIVLISLLQYQLFPNPGGLIIWSTIQALDQFCSMYLFCIIGRVLLSWFDAPNLAAVKEVLFMITEPLMRFFRRYIPPISGIDLSPVAAILLIQVISIGLLAPLNSIGSEVAFI